MCILITPFKFCGEVSQRELKTSVVSVPSRLFARAGCLVLEDCPSLSALLDAGGSLAWRLVSIPLSRLDVCVGLPPVAGGLAQPHV